MSSTTWLVRLGDQVLGPISGTELRDRAMQGSLTAQTPVSCDGTNWTEAATVDAVPPGAAPKRTVTPQVRLGHRRIQQSVRGQADSGFLATLVCIGLFIFVAIYFWNWESNARRYDKLCERGLVLAETGEFDSAISDFTEAIQIAPEHARAYYNRGWVYHQKHEHDKAIADCTIAVTVDPKDTGGYYNRGVAYYGKGENDLAIADYTEAIHLDPGFTIAYEARASAYWAKCEYDKAIADHTEAIHLDPQDAQAYGARGMVYCEQGKFGEAVLDLTEAIRLAMKTPIADNAQGISVTAKIAALFACRGLHT